MPFSDRVNNAHNFVATDTNWTFVSHDGELIQVPVFVPGVAGEFNPAFERMFKALFGAVVEYLQANGWEEQGSWVQVRAENILWKFCRSWVQMRVL
jgi:hypothetical protein